jgi:signal transduction histidine kinase
MTAIRIWWLPVLMGIGQILVWPVAPYIFTQAPEPLDAAGAVVITVVIAVALGWRMRAPVPALVVCVVAASIGATALPTDVLTIIGLSDLVVLFSLAALRPARYPVVAVAVLVAVWVSVLAFVGEPDFGWAVGLVVIIYTTVAALGANRGRWQRARADAAARLLAAEAEQRRAAEAERERLARELHDVTAHHLTAIVVNAGAARRLGAGRPELVRQALEFAAETGRRTLTALNRLVTVIEPGAGEPLALRLGRLATTARSAGQQVTVTVEGAADALPPPLVDAVFAVVQEAATNAWRYAPGAEVTAVVTVSDGSVRVEVTNPSADAAGAAGSLGSGRGLAGLAARAKDLGGTFDAAPVPAGGWRVCADIPCVTPAAAGHRLSTVEGALDAVLMLVVLVPPLLVMLIDGGAVRDQWWLLTLLILLHGAPVWWRRVAPWWTLLAVVGAGLAFAVIIAVTGLPIVAADPLVLGFGAEMTAVWSIAARGRPVRTTWCGALVAAVSASLMLVVISQDLRRLAAEASSPPEIIIPVVVTLALFSAAFTVILLLTMWLPAFLLRRRRDRTLGTEAAALRAADERAAAAAQDQRQRFAVGLHASVIEPAERLIAAAESVPPEASPDAALAAVDQVTAEARAGLAAMRELLGAIQPVPTGDRSAPPRGIADLADLCSERQIQLEAGPILHPLPVAVDLSGYRIVDAALDADDTAEVVSVTVDHIRETLVVTVSGVPGATRGIVAARIRARAAALGGKIRFDPAGVVQVHLPAPPEAGGPTTLGEVPASTSA